MEIEIKDAKWDNAEHTSFTCQLNHPQFGWIPFTAAGYDTEEHGREIFAAGQRGDFPVAEYDPQAA